MPSLIWQRYSPLTGPVHSASSSYAHHGPGLHRANRKIAQYEAQVKKTGGVFLPLIANPFDGLHKTHLPTLLPLGRRN